MATYKRNPALVRTIQRAADQGARQMAVSCAAFVRQNFSKGPRGVPSRPGTPPNIQTGLMRNSTNTKRVAFGAWRAIVSVVYARIHEFGSANRRTRVVRSRRSTRSVTKQTGTPPRPYFGPILRTRRRDIHQAGVQQFRRTLQGGGRV